MKSWEPNPKVLPSYEPGSWRSDHRCEHRAAAPSLDREGILDREGS
jgi:hypothetical protein